MHRWTRASALVFALGTLEGCSAHSTGSTRSVDRAGAEQAIAHLLDTWHHAAATGDGDVYFGAMADDFVFLGTDATERWPRDEFVAFAEPYFDGEEAWTYTPTQRWIEAGTVDRGVVWFDELLHNDKYGTSRGTGVAVRDGGVWKLGAYGLTFPIPNDLAGGMTAEIKAYEASRPEDD